MPVRDLSDSGAPGGGERAHRDHPGQRPVASRVTDQRRARRCQGTGRGMSPDWYCRAACLRDWSGEAVSIDHGVRVEDGGAAHATDCFSPGAAGHLRFARRERRSRVGGRHAGPVSPGIGAEPSEHDQLRYHGPPRSSQPDRLASRILVLGREAVDNDSPK